MKVMSKHITELKEAKYNPREITEHDFKQIKKSLEAFGFVSPVIINVNKERKNIIIGGHMRVRAARELRIKKIPCIELDLSLEKEKELNIRLNRNQGRFDFDILANTFSQQELRTYGFTNYELSFFSLPEPQSKPVELSIKVTFKEAEMSSFEALRAYLNKKGYDYTAKLN